MADQQNSSNDFALAMSFKVEGHKMLVLSLRVTAALATFGAYDTAVLPRQFHAIHRISILPVLPNGVGEGRARNDSTESNSKK